ncbi:P-loop containing nucleoside triphosphate hydrolase protein [Pavlovales sp. CCMP2436]|nr:P-loop containing nucleoside triphosphate hydrolase protein [Pavlovales sp. CCMP2436]
MRGEQFTHLDVDVAAEAYAVLGGNLPDEKPVVFYDVAKSFGSTKAVRGVSVSLQQDELFALLGRNGAGKTTIVNMLTAKSAVSRGDMLLYGASVANDVDKVRSMIGVCTQEDVLHASLSASQHLWLFGRFYGVRGKDLREKVKEALDDVNLTQVRHKRAGHFSGGMKRRLSLACAYVGEPSVVALDEPTSGMDPYNRKKVWDVITSKKLSGRTTLLTTNSMEEAEVLAHTVGILAEGQLIALGSAPHLKVRARLPEVELVDVTASSCTYSIAEDKMARANKLLRYIEQLKKESDDYFDQFRRPTFDAPPQSKSAWLLQQLGFSAKRLNPPAAHSQASDGLASDSPSGERAGGQPAHAHAHAPPPKILLKDWLVTHTSLEEVFVRLAHQQNERSNKADADAPPIGAAEAEIAEEEEEIEDAAETGAPAAFEEFEDSDAGSQAGSESVYARQRARQLRAAALKNIALYRRQWRRHTTNALMSAGLILALYLSQLLLIDRPSAIFETEAARLVVELTASCTSVSDAFDKACADGTSLEVIHVTTIVIVMMIVIVMIVVVVVVVYV